MARLLHLYLSGEDCSLLNEFLFRDPKVGVLVELDDVKALTSSTGIYDWRRPTSPLAAGAHVLWYADPGFEGPQTCTRIRGHVTGFGDLPVPDLAHEPSAVCLDVPLGGVDNEGKYSPEALGITNIAWYYPAKAPKPMNAWWARLKRSIAKTAVRMAPSGDATEEPWVWAFPEAQRKAAEGHVLGQR